MRKGGINYNTNERVVTDPFLEGPSIGGVYPTSNRAITIDQGNENYSNLPQYRNRSSIMSRSQERFSVNEASKKIWLIND